MKSIIQDMKHNYFINAIIMVVLGLILVIWPHILGVVLCYVLGGALVLMGIFQLIGFVRGERLGFDSLIAAGITLVLGLLLVLNPFTAYEVTMFLIGLAMLYDGGSDLVILFFSYLAQKDTDRRVRDFKG